MLDTNKAKAVDALFETVDKAGHPGACLAILKGGETAYLRSFGLANVEDEVPVTPDTIFRIGSISKSFCATLIKLLIERGLVRLEDRIVHHLPDLPPSMAEITIRHLLTMTSGLHDTTTLTIFGGRGHLAMSREMQLKLVERHEELMFAPGAQMLYSNTNYMLLSVLIERLTGKTIEAAFEDEIFRPLGLSTARLVANGLETTRGKAKGYLPSASPTGFEAGLMLYEASGDGAIDMSMRDFIRWFNFCRSGEPLGLEARSFLEQEVRLASGELSYYRAGMSVFRRSGRIKVTHAGGMPGYIADFAFYPEQDIAVLILTNWMDPGILDAADRILDILEEKAAKPQPSIDAEGLYFTDNGMAVQIMETPQGKRCFMMGDAAELVHCSDGWRPVRKPTEYCIAEAEPDRLRISFGEEPVTFRRWQERPSPADLVSYVGTYRNEMTGERHLIRLGDNKLRVTLGTLLRQLAWADLHWRDDDLFSADVADEPTPTNLTLRFERDDRGRITGFRYTTFRCRGLLFRRIPE